MLTVKTKGAEGFISQMIWTDDSPPVLIACSLSGREIAVRALVADFLTTRSMAVELGEHMTFIYAGMQNTFRLKGQKISPEVYQVLIWNGSEQENVIRKKDFCNYIGNKFTVPFHESWAEEIWSIFMHQDLVQPLKTFGTDEFFIARFSEGALQEAIIENLPELKQLLKKAA